MAKLAAKVLPSVLLVEITRLDYEDGRAQLHSSYGSGMVFRNEGYVLTNSHVIQHAKRVTCTMADGRCLEAEILGNEPATDIAVLRLLPPSPEKFRSVAFGDPYKLKAGDLVMVIGNPRRLTHTVSKGIVSHPKRYFRRSLDDTMVEYGGFYLWIQTDAVIEPGSSGGPLLDSRGRVVGMATRHTGDDLGLAIPSDMLQLVAERIIKFGNARLADFGLDFQSMSALEETESPGAIISSVIPESPADQAGLKPGDILFRFGDKAVHAPREEDIPAIRRLLAFAELGKTYRALVRRGEDVVAVEISAASGPAYLGRYVACEKWGFTAQELSRRHQQLFGHTGPAVRISSIASGSPASRAQLQVNDILHRIGPAPVPDAPVLERIYQNLTSLNSLETPFQVRHGKEILFGVLRMEPPVPE